MLLLFAAAAACAAFPTTTSADAGFPPDFPASVLAGAREADTDSLLILKDGKVAVSLAPDKRLNIYSVTKAVTSLLAGRLFTTGVWRDVDAPLASLLPEFAGDPKGAVTLRQIMSHTSGIADARDANGRMLKSWNEARDWRAEALKQPMRDAPGTVYRYTSLGPALVGLAIEQASGMRLDKFAERELFAPLCIDDYRWITDRAGHAAGYMGLSLSAASLAKLGQLVLQRGMWQGQRVLSEEWIRMSAFEPSQTVRKSVGLFWFMALQPERFPLPVLIKHDGDGGQELSIFPNHGTVGVRLRGSLGETKPFTVSDAVAKMLREQRAGQ